MPIYLVCKTNSQEEENSIVIYTAIKSTVFIINFVQFIDTTDMGQNHIHESNSCHCHTC